MRQVEVSSVYERNARSTAQIIINQGGARSTKSWSIAQRQIQRFWNEKRKKILITRKTGPALKLSAYRLVLDLLQDYGFYRYCEHNKTDHTIFNPFNGSIICFLSIDDPEKIKSTEWNYIWMEEATEFTWNDFITCRTRLSGPTVPEEPNQIILSFNPTDENGWIQQKVILGPAFANKIDVIHSTYHDNPFLDDDYIQILEGLKEQDADAYRIFTLGQYGLLSNIIYAPYEVVPEFTEPPDEVIYGLDFGFNNPSGLLEIGIKDLRNCYLKQLIYRTGLLNSGLIELAKTLIPEEHRARPIYADAAEPDRIEEFLRAGFNIYPADKEVKAGLDFCKRQKYFTLASNIDLNKERGSYKWRTDKNGNILDEPVKFMDHLMDAKRYALYTHFKAMLSQPNVWMIE